MVSGVRPNWDFLNTTRALFHKLRHSAQKKLVEVATMLIMKRVTARCCPLHE